MSKIKYERVNLADLDTSSSEDDDYGKLFSQKPARSRPQHFIRKSGKKTWRSTLCFRLCMILGGCSLFVLMFITLAYYNQGSDARSFWGSLQSASYNIMFKNTSYSYDNQTTTAYPDLSSTEFTEESNNTTLNQAENKLELDGSIDIETDKKGVKDNTADFSTSDQITTNQEKSTNEIIKKSAIMTESDMIRSRSSSDQQSSFSSNKENLDSSFYSSARY